MEGRAERGCAKAQWFEITACGLGVETSSRQPPFRIPCSTHLQAGHPDAHCPHEQEVVGQELFQFGDAASL